MSIAYFAHELGDAAVDRRLRMLRAAGCDVTLLGFERDRGADKATPTGAYVLGRTRNQRFAQRILAVFAAIPRLLKERAAWRDAKTIIARNLEMLALAIMASRLAGVRPRIVYECLDIHRLMIGDGAVPRILRAVERFCLRRVDLVITSSPAFEQRHFRQTQRFAGAVLLAENKVLDLDGALAPIANATPTGAPWTIVWCGVLRCARSFSLLSELARSQAGRVKVELWGVPALDQIPHFHQALAATPNMIYHGRYAPSDLARIYGDAHFAWAMDFYEAGGNSDWLLPNRLYESLAYGSVPIAVSGVETARWLEAHNVGAVLDEPLPEQLAKFFASLTAEKMEALIKAAEQRDPSLVSVDLRACRDFAAKVSGAAA